MDTNKVSNLFSYLKDKHGEDRVKLLRIWEFTVKKMADYRNHRRFTLKCIKVGIIPVGCRVRNPLKTHKCYQIIHKAENQLLYDRVRNINYILYRYGNNRAKCNSQLRNLIQEDDIIKCMFLINKIKEYRHNKVKGKQIDKFECLFRKSNIYQHNFGIFSTFGRHTLLGRHPHNNTTTQKNMDSCHTNTTTRTSTIPTAPRATTTWETTAARIPANTAADVKQK